MTSVREAFDKEYQKVRREQRPPTARLRVAFGRILGNYVIDNDSPRDPQVFLDTARSEAFRIMKAAATTFVIVARNARCMHTPPPTGLINLRAHYNIHEFILPNISKIFTHTISKNTRNQSHGHEKRFSFIFFPQKNEETSTHIEWRQLISTATSVWRQYESSRV